jgi:hypothetical protein
MVRLEAFPTELLQAIAAFTEDADLNAFRQTSKTIRDAVTKEFGQRHFVERNHVLTAFGVQALLDIARHPTLCKFLRVVTFNVTTNPSSPKFIEE